MQPLQTDEPLLESPSFPKQLPNRALDYVVKPIHRAVETDCAALLSPHSTDAALKSSSLNHFL